MKSIVIATSGHANWKHLLKALKQTFAKEENGFCPAPVQKSSANFLSRSQAKGWHSAPSMRNCPSAIPVTSSTNEGRRGQPEAAQFTKGLVTEGGFFI